MRSEALWQMALISFSLIGASCSPTARETPSASKPDELTLSLWKEPPYGLPPASYNRIDIDTHSGDLLYYENFSDASGKVVMVETRFSKEVHRLGMGLPQARNWRLVWMPTDRSPANVKFLYPDVVDAANRLVGLLDRVRRADEERRPILEELLTSLRTEEPEHVCMRADLLSLEVTEKYGLPGLFRPDYALRLKELRRSTAR